MSDYAQIEAFRLDGDLTWDLMFTEDGSHAFYLKAPPEYRNDPHKRHWAASIGHAVLQDGRWLDAGTAIKPGPPGTYNDMAIWTGSVYEPEDADKTDEQAVKAVFYYTSLSHKDRGETQRIFMATTTKADLTGWEQAPNIPLLVPGGYYSADPEPKGDNCGSAFRDPFVFQDPATKLYEMLITARTATDEGFNACIGRASSTHPLRGWKLRPPIFAPKRRYAQMEVPQMIITDGGYYLTFSNWEGDASPEWETEVGKQSGLFCYKASSLDGDYEPVNENGGVIVPNAKRVYGVRIIRQPDGSFVGIGWPNEDERGNVLGGVTEPIPIDIGGGQVLADAAILRSMGLI